MDWTVVSQVWQTRSVTAIAIVRIYASSDNWRTCFYFAERFLEANSLLFYYLNKSTRYLLSNAHTHAHTHTCAHEIFIRTFCATTWMFDLPHRQRYNWRHFSCSFSVSVSVKVSDYMIFHLLLSFSYCFQFLLQFQFNWNWFFSYFAISVSTSVNWINTGYKLPVWVMTVISEVSDVHATLVTAGMPLSSIRQHRSYDEFLEDKSEDYQSRSVLYCVTQSYTMIHINRSCRWTVGYCFRIRLGVFFVFY